MDRPEVSIIVPNYNHAQFLKQRLESIFNQTYQNFEVILLDDSSTDDSVSILEKYSKHSKVSHFKVNAVNSGSPFKQWKKGMSLAKGEYIWIAESDDYCEPEFLEKLLKLFIENIVVVYCASFNADENGNPMVLNNWANQVKPEKWSKNYVNKGTNEINEYLRYRNTIPNASAVIFKNNLSLHDIPVEMKYCGDWYLWIELLKKGDIAYLSLPLNYFRKHQSSTRVLKSIDNEKQRIFEYFKILIPLSSFNSRWIDRKKYNWIINQLVFLVNHYGIKSFKHFKMPLDFRIRLLLKSK